VPCPRLRVLFQSIEMREEVIDQIRQLDLVREARALAEHVAVTSPDALAHLARERMVSPGHEARRLSGIQLRVVTELGARLEWVEDACADASMDPALRAALAGLVGELVAGLVDHPRLETRAAPLLETAFLFHRLLAHLRPWLPPLTIALEPEPVHDILMLGIPDYLHALVHARFEGLWALFHRTRSEPCPPPPSWSSPAWATAWTDAPSDAPHDEARQRHG